MEKVHQVIKCVEKCPSEADVIDLKSQLSGFTRDNLRAACSRLKLSVRDEQKKKSGLISVVEKRQITGPSFRIPGKNRD